MGASLLGNLLVEKGIDRVGKGIARADEGYKLMLPRALTNFEIQKYYKNEPRFNGVNSRDNLPNKIKDGAYVINLDEYSDRGTHWVAVYVKNNDITYFDSFGVEHILIEIKTFIGRSSSSALLDKSIKTNIFRIQAYDSIMSGYFCIGFINFMFEGRSLTEYTNLFSPNNFIKMIK